VISFCFDIGCRSNACSKEVHINCTCSAEMKIPIKDLAFERTKRKIRSVAPLQIDLPEHNR